MRLRGREAGVPLILGLGSYALAFAQRPGLATADTKINLHVDPSRFLADVASMWTSTGQLGEVQAGQQAGYLFPMGPFFALGHALGLPDWVVQRLWLGSLLALAAWGAVRLLDALLGRPRGIAHLVAGAVMVLNPFVVTYANRTTVTLLAYAALPWLLLVVHRGLRDPRAWRWPAAFALLVAASGGGVNGAVTAWMLLGPMLLLLYELFMTPVGRRAAGSFAWRTFTLTVLASIWWIVPAYVQSSYGIDFLHFTEQPGTIWGTTSATETLRLMSFWLSYVGLGFGGTAIPYFDDSHTLLFSAPVVVATLLLPAAALTGFVWTRRWRYGPFFLGLAVAAVLVMMAGFPDGTPLRHGLTFTYNHFAAVQFLRASYKAAPLLAVALACLAGAAAGEAWRRMRTSEALARLGTALTGLARAGAVAAVLAVLALAAWPLVTGRAQDAQVSYKRIPAAWTQAATDLDRQLPANSRAMVLPGDLFSFYTWGGTVDPILPALSTRPVAERSEVPYADLRATDLLWTIDGLVHQQRLLPGQLAPLLGLIGARAVITATDDDLARSDAPPPADVAAELSAQPGFAHAARSYGPWRSFTPTGLGPPVRLPQVRRYDLPAGRGLTRIEPRADPVVIDGSADALAGLAAFGSLPTHRALLYAGDLGAGKVRTALAGGGTLVVSDSNRRQAFVVGSLDQNAGPTLPADQDVSADGLILDPFKRGPDYETVAAFHGIRSVQAPESPERVQFPERGPFAAIDGSPTTAWVADPTLDSSQRWLQVDFTRPRDVPYVELEPFDDAGGSVRQVQIAGRTFDVHPGLNRLALGLHSVGSLRVTLTAVSPPQPGAAAGAGGIRELQIPGIRAAEYLRLPVDAARGLSGANVSMVALKYLFQRTTGDDPDQRDPASSGPSSALDVDRHGDAEAVMRRVFELPAARRFTASAWVTVSAGAVDDALDRLAGYRGPARATSSSRFDGEPRWRASSALDGDPATAWIGDYALSRPAWLQWDAPRAMHISRLILRPPALPVGRPTAVSISWPGGSTGPLPVARGGTVKLPRPVSARRLRITVLRAAAPAGADATDRRAVGIAEITGISGLPRISAPRAGAFSAPCGTAALTVGGRRLALRIGGSRAAFENGSPLPARSCATVALEAGTQQLVVAPGPLAVDELQLSSPAPPPSGAVAGGGRLLAAGTSGRGSYDHVRVDVNGPSWLVLGESYNRGWQAFCNGRQLGAPVPIDGYANGWPVSSGCRQVRFAFAPNRLAEIGYLISAVAGLGCLILLLVPVLTRRSGERAPAPAGAARAPAPPAIESPPPQPLAPLRALLVAVAPALAFGFVFGVPAGVVSYPVIALVLWRAIGATALTLGAGILLGVVVPVLYLLHPGEESGGNHFGYADAHMAANWAGVAALGLLIAALWRTLRGPRRARGPITPRSRPPREADTAALRR